MVVMENMMCDSSQRLDVFLAVFRPEISRVKAGALVREGMVLVNGRIVLKPAHRLKPGDAVSVSPLKPTTESHIPAVDLHLPVLFEDEQCMVISKPAGISVHPGNGMAPGTTTLLSGMAWEFKKRDIPFSASHILAHRLDRETTGCLLVAKSPEAHRMLQAQFKARTVGKTYLALVAGIPQFPKATISAPIGRNLADRTKMSVLHSSTSREALTDYSTLAASDNCALIACVLRTGRTHQIRVHLSAIGHSLIGDPTYHSPESRKISDEMSITQICLHAWKISFVSPLSKRTVEIEDAIPETFRESMRKLSLSFPHADETSS